MTEIRDLETLRAATTVYKCVSLEKTDRRQIIYQDSTFKGREIQERGL